MRNLLALLILVSAFSQGLQAKPNLILIIADDLGAEDSAPFGNSAVRTPNLARLAEGGLRFDRAFVTTSSCSPSRCSMITGRFPHQTGAAQLHQPLPAEQVTFVEMLRAAGYYTAQAGKWHLGPATKKKFDTVNEGGGPSGCEKWVEVLQNRPRDKPFFLWLAALDPHRDYKPGTIDPPHDPAKVIVPPYFPDNEQTRRDLAMYYDEITRLDGYVGKVLDELEAQKVADNTLILFLSDNGRPFPRCKTTLYDSGIRTPLIARWPGRIKGGGATGSLASSIDLAPTFLAAAGLKAAPTMEGKDLAPIFADPAAAVRDHIIGEKHWHDFDDHARAVRTERFKYVRNFYTDIPNLPPADAVRSLTYQSMRALRDQKQLNEAQRVPFNIPRAAEELYDVQADPHELKNVAADPKYAEDLSRLRGLLEQHQQKTADQVPAARTADLFDRETGEMLKKGKGGK